VLLDALRLVGAAVDRGEMHTCLVHVDHERRVNLQGHAWIGCSVSSGRSDSAACVHSD
jgi:hypothetical protein